MVLIGIAGLPGSGKQEFMSFLHNYHKLKIYKLSLPAFLSNILSNICESPKNGEILEENKEEIKENQIFSNENGIKEYNLEEIAEMWNEDIVIGPLYSLEKVKTLRKKPYFHLVFIESAVLHRFANFQRKYTRNIDILQFLKLEEQISHGLQLEEIRKLAKFDISNSGSLLNFHETVQNNIKYIMRPIKPTWDQYFMNIAFSVRTRSNCMRKNAGAILVQNNRIISTGYTGTPQGLMNCNEGGCQCCNENKEDLVQCLCIHAEENCILEVGISGSEGAICYCTQFPCIWCTKVLIQGKIKKLVYFREEDDVEEPLALEILKQNKIEKIRFLKDFNVF